MLVFSCMVVLISVTVEVQSTSNSDVKVTSIPREIHFTLKDSVADNKTIYIVIKDSPSKTSTVPVMLYGSSNKTVKVINLALNSTVHWSLLKEAIGDGLKDLREATTKYPTNIVPNILPGAPRDITLCGNNICWKTPTNIFQSSNENDKSIEYHISVCRYSPPAKRDYMCEYKGIVVDNGKSEEQTTDGWGVSMKTTFEANGDMTINSLAGGVSQLTADSFARNRDIVVIIKPYSINATYGTAERMQTRLDKATEPTAPVINKAVQEKDKYRVFINWTNDISLSNVSSYVIQYKKATDNSSMFKDVKYKKIGALDPEDTTLFVTYAIDLTKVNSMLKENTKYAVRVAIDESEKGASKFSAEKEFTTGKFSSGLKTASVLSTILVAMVMYSLST